MLKPGGRFAVSDVVVRGAVPDAVRQSMMLWVGCIAGALEEQDYRARLIAAGFADVDIEPTRIYNVEDARQFLTEAGVDVDAIAPAVEGKFLSAFIRAVKPQPSCCAPGCCGGSSPQSDRSHLCRTTTTSCFSAPGTRPAPSWPRRFSTTRAKARLPPTARAAIPRGTPRPEALAQIASAGHVNRRPAQQILGRVRRARRAQMDFVFTVCDNAAKEACPFWPGQPMTAHWGIPDPAAVQGTPEEIARAFRDAFVILDRRIGLFLSLPFATLAATRHSERNRQHRPLLKRALSARTAYSFIRGPY